MRFLQMLFWAASAVLQLLVLATLLKGAYKRYPFVFAYSVVLILTLVIEVGALADAGYATAAAKRYFWVNDLVRQSLLFAVVISLIYRAAGSNRGVLCRALVAGAALVAAFSFYTNLGFPVGTLMTTVGRNLSFCSAVLNLVLWSLLIVSRDKDRQLLLVVGGLGIQFTAEAIGQSLRFLAVAGTSRFLVQVGNILMAGGHIVCLSIWFQAFQRGVPEKSSLEDRTSRSVSGEEIDRADFAR